MAVHGVMRAGQVGVWWCMVVYGGVRRCGVVVYGGVWAGLNTTLGMYLKAGGGPNRRHRDCGSLF
jgi:hypothetical protein